MAATIDNAWIRRFHPAPQARHRLVCFPHAGGSANYFVRVSRSLSPSVEVLAVQYPGRQGRRHEACIDNVPDFVDGIAAALAGWTDRPLSFFGHSMGAMLAFEVARRLEKGGVVLSGLFLSGRRAPSCPRDEAYHLLSDDALLAELRKLDGTDASLLGEADMVAMILQPLRSDFKVTASYQYVPGPNVTCPIFALVGDSDPMATIDEARSWREYTSNTFELRAFPGGHFYLADHQAEIAGMIADQFASATR